MLEVVKHQQHLFGMQGGDQLLGAITGGIQHQPK
jgi:hypothetical protein